MNDSYVEYLVKKETPGYYGFLKAILYAAAAVSVFLGLFGAFIMLVPAVIFIVLIILVLPGMDLEYEYLYLDKSLTIDKIFSKQKRKRAKELDLSKMECLCPAHSHELDQYTARNIKIQDYSSGNPDVKMYVLVYRGDNDVELIGIDGSDEMIKVLKSVYPRKIIEY